MTVLNNLHSELCASSLSLMPSTLVFEAMGITFFWNMVLNELVDGYKSLEGQETKQLRRCRHHIRILHIHSVTACRFLKSWDDRLNITVVVKTVRHVEECVQHSKECIQSTYAIIHLYFSCFDHASETKYIHILMVGDSPVYLCWSSFSLSLCLPSHRLVCFQYSGTELQK